MNSILVIDDEKSICSSLQFALEDHYNVFTTTDPNEGISIIKNQEIDLVLLDLRLKDIDGIEILKEIKSIDQAINVIMMTAYSTIESSVKAMKEGAYYYITKPINMEQLFLLIQKAFEYESLKKEVHRLHQSLDEKNGYGRMIGKSKKMEKVYHLIEKVKDIDSNVLITGESGTGKELVARTIHELGNRKNGPFEVVNCAAIPENLLESELFGYRKGTFTGAVHDKVGKFVSADGGTLFLDEIGELPLSLQAKILRVIQEREVTPLGTNKKIKINFRLVSATNRNLFEMVQKGQYREDLYFRLNVIPIHLPPLRERKEDLPLFIQHFLEKNSQRMKKPIKQLSRSVTKFLYEYDYPGNVRELSNIIEYAVALSQNHTIDFEDLPPFLKHNHSEANVQKEDGDYIVFPIGSTLKEIEKKTILKTLEYYGGHRKNTAAVLGISERSLRNKLKEYRSKQ
ncbi:sigma-54-dependent transcriptional regulator [Bacillus alveayuensis]|uniref:sigma-54-dependent transcriptional regulator n=1 Tax=Aeribacillus alveayuensis TaxID=279215 RepID=UPI0005CC972D|nr:sigma-54 dependent transcriptional regulator [Bacillus alveayuensis]